MSLYVLLQILVHILQMWDMVLFANDNSEVFQMSIVTLYTFKVQV